MARAWINTEELRTRVKKVDKLREEEPVDVDSILPFVKNKHTDDCCHTENDSSKVAESVANKDLGRVGIFSEKSQ
jgi:hypothetical protein